MCSNSTSAVKYGTSVNVTDLSCHSYLLDYGQLPTQHQLKTREYVPFPSSHLFHICLSLKPENCDGIHARTQRRYDETSTNNVLCTQDRTAINAPIVVEKNGKHSYGTVGYGYFNAHHYVVNTYVAINRLVAIHLHLSID